MIIEAYKRDEFIVQDYIAGTDISELARTYALTDRRVRQILKEGGIALRARTAVSEKRPLSRLHEAIGRKLIDHRFDNGDQANEVANALGWNLTKLRKVEQGLSPLELLDLVDLSTYLKLTLTEVVALGRSQ